MFSGQKLLDIGRPLQEKRNRRARISMDVFVILLLLQELRKPLSRTNDDRRDCPYRHRPHAASTAPVQPQIRAQLLEAVLSALQGAGQLHAPPSACPDSGCSPGAMKRGRMVDWRGRSSSRRRSSPAGSGPASSWPCRGKPASVRREWNPTESRDCLLVNSGVPCYPLIAKEDTMSILAREQKYPHIVVESDVSGGQPVVEVRTPMKSSTLMAV